MLQSRVGPRPQEVTIGMAAYGAETSPTSFVVQTSGMFVSITQVAYLDRS
jgi:hypothetical protein